MNEQNENSKKIEEDLCRLKQEYTILFNRFKNLIYNSPAGYFQVDKSFSLIKVNDSWLKMHRFESRSEILWRPFTETILETDRLETETLLYQVLAGENISRNIYRRKCKDDSVGYHAVSLSPVESTESIIGVEGLIVDLGDAVNSEDSGKGINVVLNQFATVSGMLPICASCKKIRDDQGYWNGVEQYFMEHSQIEFTHSICPECERRLYPDLFNQDDK